MAEQRDPRTFAIIGAAMEVHTVLGCGFLEAVYQESMALELTSRAIPFIPQLELPVSYKGTVLKASYKPDFICYDEVVVELKALAAIGGVEEAQILNYLKVTGYRTGLLLNFGTRSLQYKRFVMS
jgi:GxxExxY protein